MLRVVPAPPEEVDVAALATGKRTSTPTKPWVMTNMVTSINGSYSVEGVSGPLSNPVDKSLLHELRKHADVLLVGRKTVEAERYSRPTTSRERPRLALVSSSTEIRNTSSLFEPSQGAHDPLPIIVTSAATSPTADVGLAETSDLRSLTDPQPAVLRAGAKTSGGGVDFTAALGELRKLGAEVVLCEGGPDVYRQLLAANLVNEVNLTTAPLAVAPAGQTPIEAPYVGSFTLSQLAVDTGYIFARYLRAG